MAKTEKTQATALLASKDDLFATICRLIEEGRRTLAQQANRTTVFLFWRIGLQIRLEVLNQQRAEYGQKIVASLATQLVTSYGRSFEARNLRRMMQFAELFPDFEIVSPLATQLSWAHVVEVLPLQTQQARLFYLGEVATRQLGKRELRQLISRKTYERKEIANAQLAEASAIPLDTFKDPYLLDVLGLHDGYLEADMEAAILRELERFILELGGGFTFVSRQKRMIIDGEDFHLDLLFFHRKLKRLVAEELKLGKFEAGYKGQMELYLGWLDRHERQEGENAPIGLILCAEKSREQIELLQLDKDKIMVAEYWTVFPERSVFERKIHALLASAREQLARRKSLLAGAGKRDADRAG
ncbi:putative nuclease of restriction endonuclease-like (RecB) superfamily [Paucibacter oligotrophus]|uniref:Putative nuclease of restriction endonuclease-like (RecB) superfamily n=1 Tax=Roseateles oligotrophus TaxID=1769250 RepID=A0A840LHR5_9BURK|nr:PDDEXK nuclease domain-containing protein [Roseateles oligotrophus]MBB4845559.1 putative nuclease of restriction endonuclease-like (RecB) superfamily [Roseateles oligotrophus]